MRYNRQRISQFVDFQNLIHPDTTNDTFMSTAIKSDDLLVFTFHQLS